MLKFYHGTELERLADRLIEELDANPPENPLQPEKFIVQNHGIGQWLSLRIAEKQGIAANLEFEFPSERIWKLIRLTNPDIPDTLTSDREPMTWSLMELFEDQSFLTEFENLRHYIADDDPTRRSMRSFKLASKIADVFDQYLIYRPDMILDWEKGESFPENEQWQVELWNRLMEHWKEYFDERWIHRARLQKSLWSKLDKKELDINDLPKRITVFGISTVSPAFIKTMVKLSKLTDVHFYQLTVNPEIKESEAFENSLLQSLGRESANFMKQLSSCVKADKEVAEARESVSVLNAPSDKESVFTAVQADLKNDKPVRGRNLDVPPIDSSIQVHSCHSPMREVEVLYDQLLALLDQNPGLSPDEILIMTPDIETYAPMIEAVFESPDDGQPKIPYAIADRGIDGAYPATDAFLKILDLCESRFKVTDVLDLLDANPIQEAFDFSDEELNRIEQWVRDNRIRWGIDGKNRQKLDLPASDHFTWKSGLRRILLGYVMKPGDDLLYNDIFAYDEVETSDDAELAGKVSSFLNRLFDINSQVANPQKTDCWQRLLNEIIDQFLPDNRDYYWEISKMREGLNQLSEQSSLGRFEQRLPFAVMRSWLKKQLQERTTGGGRIGRGVTFSSLNPMHSIPFEVIGMIGMNEDAFPRSKIPIEFDLMHLDPQPGDPSQSDEDRFLFLKNLLSAKTHFYASYVGQSNRQDADFPPSVVLKEFLNFLDQQCGLRSDDIITNHRLQAFSPHYFEDGEHFSYSRLQLRVSQELLESTSGARAFFKQNLPEPDEEWRQLPINDFISFFQHPAKFLLRNRLGIYLRKEDDLAEDREPFEVDSLDEYQIGQELLQRYLKQQPLESYKRVIRSRDMLPEGWSGAEGYRKKTAEVQEFGAEIQERLDQKELPDQEVNIEIGDFHLVGTLSNIYPDAQMTYRFGKARPQDLIDWWIRHLLFQQVKPEGHSGRSVFFAWEDGTFEEHHLAPVEDAITPLNNLLNLYWEGLQKPLHLYCKSSYAYAKAISNPENKKEDGIAKAVNEWDASWNGIPGEGDDPYYKLITGGEQPFDNPQFAEYSCDVWDPFLEVLNREDALT